jgi:hypothetical protein
MDAGDAHECGLLDEDGGRYRHPSPLSKRTQITLDSTAVLLLWSDIDPNTEAEYNRWHSTERRARACFA